MMNDTHPEPQPASSIFEKEYQDAHFHDDDQETQLNDVDFDAEHGSARSLSGKKKPNRRPPPRRRFMDD